jgi:CHAT domain-containing protein
MNNDKNDNPRELSQEDLLRFLDGGPRLVRPATGTKLAQESSCFETEVLECPKAESYMQLATGAVEGDEAAELLTHAAACNICADVLASSLGALEGNPSPEEIAAIAELATIQADWQESLSRKLAATQSQKRPRFANPNQWVGAAGIAAVVLLAAGVLFWQRKTHNPEHQLAMAYEMSRTLELRVPDAGYTRFASTGHTRGNATDSEPAPLLDARARLARELERSPQDAHWLELQARADVMEERYDSAIDMLDRLLAQGPVTAELLTDAASAYYQRGLVSGNELDRSTALDYLRRADEMAPTDPVILFNEAIVMEDRGQMMNAVEVWNRYITIERDPQWSAEGKRKLAALEETLNRLKSHQSRIEHMLATPQAMDALAADAAKLAPLDEELSTYELDKLVVLAYPLAYDPTTGPASGASQQARGSPCSEACLSARKLLKAIASCLETRHHDSWLNDLISPDIGSLSLATSNTYKQALQLLGRAIREDLTGVPAEGVPMAAKAGELFLQMKSSAGYSPALESAIRAGEERTTVEYLLALQRTVNFSQCRAVAQQFDAKGRAQRENERYPWIEAQALVTEKVCDDTPDTRQSGRALAFSALLVAEENNYLLLASRIQLMLSGDALDSGDEETGERLVLTSLRRLYSADSPPLRIANTVAALAEIEQVSPLARVNEGSLRETAKWLELAGNYNSAALARMGLARAEMRIGAMNEAENQIRSALKEGTASRLGETSDTNFREEEILLASSMLERGSLHEAALYLDQATSHLRNSSDTWALRQYAAARGMLDLATGHLDQAASGLESEIRTSEGKDVRRADRATTAEFAQLDHDLYAELAATWLAQGREPESALALWERFRLRSRGLPITQCPGDALDCEETRLVAARQNLDGNLLIGQILLLDRVLVYRADKNGVTWSSIPRQRQDVLDAAKTLERAVSSPLTSTSTAERLGAKLSDALLPPIPAKLGSDAFLILEPDPMLQNLPWPVLPTPTGPLGLQYPLAEMRSILAVTSVHGEGGFASATEAGDRSRSLVVGASTAGSGEPPLPEALKEARDVGSYLHAPQLLLGNQATVAHLAQALDTATIFHFAGHALQTDHGTELLLAPASPEDKRPWIDGTYLRQHPPRACRLAVLSACATGVREASWNHPLQDIVETLGSIGVPEVVATRWQIDSEAAVPFMDAFYQSMAKGNNVAMALTLARRLQFLQAHNNSPYYWGAFYVTCTEKAQRRKELYGSQ